MENNESLFKNTQTLSIQKHDEFGVFGERVYLKSEMTELEWNNLITKTEKEHLENNPFTIYLDK